jgi:enoyl-CoA hydratase
MIAAGQPGREDERMSRYDGFERIKVEPLADGVLDVVCHFVGKHNIHDAKAHQEMARIWPIVSHDPDVKAVVLRGCNHVLGGGGTPEMITKLINDWPLLVETYQEARDIVMGVIECSKPIVAAIEGSAVGGALAAAIVADISVAGNNAKIVDPHTLIGLVAGDGAAIIWPLLCGMARTKLHLLTGEPLDGKGAADIGLISMAVEDDRVVERAMELARKMAVQPVAAIRWTKHSLNGWLRMATPVFDHSLALEYVTLLGPDVKSRWLSRSGQRPEAT